MAGPDKRKQSLYFPEEMLKEISGEAIRLDRSLSWVMQRAWRIASTEVARFPSAVPGTARPPPAPRDAAPVPPPEREASAQVRAFVAGKFDSQ